MDAVAYIRVSTNKEEQELSLENQREFFEKYVGNRNDTLIRIYSDKGKSATKMKNRKDLQRLFECGKAWRVSAFICQRHKPSVQKHS